MDEGEPGMVGVVVPTNRPEKFLEFFGQWGQYFEDYGVTLYVVEDAPEPSFEMPDGNFRIFHLSHKDIGDLDFIPTRTGSIRSFGMLAAYRDGCDIIVTLDDDCHPVGDTIGQFTKAFRSK